MCEQMCACSCVFYRHCLSILRVIQRNGEPRSTATSFPRWYKLRDRKTKHTRKWLEFLREYATMTVFLGLAILYAMSPTLCINKSLICVLLNRSLHYLLFGFVFATCLREISFFIIGNKRTAYVSVCGMEHIQTARLLLYEYREPVVIEGNQQHLYLPTKKMTPKHRSTNYENTQSFRDSPTLTCLIRMSVLSFREQNSHQKRNAHRAIT